MKAITIRPYHSKDRMVMSDMLVSLMRYIVDLDETERSRAADTFQSEYTNHVLKQVDEHKGKILLAEMDGTPAGLIVGIVTESTPEELLECVPTRTGRILELFVEESCRGSHVGEDLVKAMEAYFAEQQCDVCRLEVFASNKNAYSFYRHMGYKDRNIDMMKMI